MGVQRGNGGTGSSVDYSKSSIGGCCRSRTSTRAPFSVWSNAQLEQRPRSCVPWIKRIFNPMSTVARGLRVSWGLSVLILCGQLYSDHHFCVAIPIRFLPIHPPCVSPEGKQMVLVHFSIPPLPHSQLLGTYPNECKNAPWRPQIDATLELRSDHCCPPMRFNWAVCSAVSRVRWV